MTLTAMLLSTQTTENIVLVAKVFEASDLFLADYE